jgi:N-acetyl sugar amidotransferase
VRYCQSCILPESRPGLVLDADGVCSACRQHAVKETAVDWDARAKRFTELVAEVKAMGRDYDCVIPVSGGKDSTWQTAHCLELGMHPLAVTWRTPGRTEIGQRNLDSLIGLGVDHIDFTVNPVVERRFLVTAFERYGTTAIPMHLAIFNIPLTVAARYGVPLVVWGEDSASEYVGTDVDPEAFQLDAHWVQRYGAVHGTTWRDWLSDELTERDLTPYRGPTDRELTEKGIRAVFLGYFFRWDPAETAAVATRHGFEAGERPRTGFYEYADIDDDFISLHHFLKWHKFGFTRTWDNLSLEIRNGRLERSEAIEVLRTIGDETPTADIERFCEYVGRPVSWFHDVCEAHRDPAIWSRRPDGTWFIEGFLIDDWDWAG